jgi:hypothetical protein
MIDWGAPTGHGIPARGATPGYRMGVDRVLKERRIGSPESVGAVAAVSFSGWAALGWPGPQEPSEPQERRVRKESSCLIRIDDQIESLDFTHQNPRVSWNE